MALYEVADGEFALARAALDAALGENPAAVLVHLGHSTLRRAVWALPAIDAALERFERAEIVWSARPLVRVLLAGHLAAKRGAAPARGPDAPPREGRRVDLLLDDAPLPPPGAPAPPGPRPFALRVRPAYHFGDGIHLAARWARGASNAGLARASARPVLRVPPPARRHAQGLADALAGRCDRPLVALLPARRPHRRWGAAAMGALARSLAARLGARVFVWPPEPVDGCATPASTLPPTSVAALLSLCALCVGDDDGWAHVAAAVGAPTLTVHGPTCPARCGPASVLGAALGAPACRSTEHARGPARRCLRCLDPAEALGLAEELAAERWPHDLVARWR